MCGNSAPAAISISLGLGWEGQGRGPLPVIIGNAADPTSEPRVILGHGRPTVTVKRDDFTDMTNGRRVFGTCLADCHPGTCRLLGPENKDRSVFFIKFYWRLYSILG